MKLLDKHAQNLQWEESDLETELGQWFHHNKIGCNREPFSAQDRGLGYLPCNTDHDYQAAEFIHAFEDTKELFHPTVFEDDDREIRGY